MSKSVVYLLLADDDEDDCLFFKEAIEELPFSVELQVVNNGQELMLLLTANRLPTVLFLDLNMPLKNGFECLRELKRNEKFQTIPVIICSTSFEPDMVNRLYNEGAKHYIRKPAEFSQLKQVIHHALLHSVESGSLQPSREEFIIKPYK